MRADEARQWYVQVLMDKVREDPYPSTTQLAMIEEALPPELVGDYLEVLMDKVSADQFPSIPMLGRIKRLIGELPQG
ncbi:MAG: hypothetical protein QOE53_3111 [Pseudonocardiales bacterium]|jgi:hypothetical protein|nr:hypothetical protein [Pseudonocardiales bacterium]